MRDLLFLFTNMAAMTSREILPKSKTTSDTPLDVVLICVFFVTFPLTGQFLHGLGPKFVKLLDFHLLSFKPK